MSGLGLRVWGVSVWGFSALGLKGLLSVRVSAVRRPKRLLVRSCVAPERLCLLLPYIAAQDETCYLTDLGRPTPLNPKPQALGFRV